MRLSVKWEKSEYGYALYTKKVGIQILYLIKTSNNKWYCSHIDRTYDSIDIAKEAVEKELGITK